VTWAAWLTGPPASGKSSVTLALRRLLEEKGIRPVVLESDALRQVLTPEATYEPQERDRFYRAVADLAAMLVEQGFPVLVDATAPRRQHRDRLRGSVPRFVEILVTAPLAVRQARDPKGLYRRARVGEAPHLPGATEAYEEPERPDLVVCGTAAPQTGALEALRVLRDRGFVRGNDATDS
jgi:adenylylsulfate kinase